MADTPEDPKLFISYSWTSPQHKQWVLDLATKLRGNGVDAILDTWDIKEGQDVIKFMEGMVTDSTINKVMMVVDKSYADKADEREGGVGVEAQIISKKIYDSHDQEKFVAIALEKDSEGKLILPVYCKSRMCIDFSEHNNKENYDKSFKDLLRWIFSTPEHEKPPIGPRPNFLLNKTSDSIPAITPYLRAIEAIKEGKGNSSGYVADYLESLSDGLEEFRIKEYEGELDEAVIESIKAFIPYRAEFIELILIITKYGVAENFSGVLHKFFEGLISYLCPPENMNTQGRTTFDNFKFIIHELFLYTVAILLKEEKFQAVYDLISKDYYVERHPNGQTHLKMSYRIFNNSLETIDRRNERLNKRQISPHADIIKERTQYSGIDFRYLIQADFLLFMRSEILAVEWYDRWYPLIVMYNPYLSKDSPEIFIRAESSNYFNSIKGLLAINDKNDMIPLFDAYDKDGRWLPSREGSPLNPKRLINFDKLATKP